MNRYPTARSIPQLKPLSHKRRRAVCRAFGREFWFGSLALFVTAPVLALAIGLLAFPLIYLYRIRRLNDFARERLRTVAGRPFHCDRCSYDLRRCRSASCPECGTAINTRPKTPRDRAQVLRARRIQTVFYIFLTIFLIMTAILLLASIAHELSRY